MKLNKSAVERLALPAGKTDFIAWDDAMPGFGVRVREGGRKSYVVQYRVGHQQRRAKIGDVRKIDLEAARRAAKRMLGAVALDRDPAAEKAAAKAKARHTMAAILPRFLERQRARVRPRSMPAIELHMKRWAPLHSIPMHLITRRDVAARLGEIESEFGPNPARGARVALSAFFAWAMREGLCEANPVIATNNLPPVKARERVLSDAELVAIWHGCEGLGDFGSIVRLLMLTGCRRDEIAELRWSEVDGDTLRLPGERTKNGRPLVLPLPGLGLDVLKSVPRREGRDRLFGKAAEAGFRNWTFAKDRLDAKIKLDPWRLHDLRRTFASGLARLGVEIATIEQCLNHRSGTFAGIVGVYQHHDFLAEKRRAMGLWNDHIGALVRGTERKILSLR